MVYTLRSYPFAVGVDLKRPGFGPNVVHLGRFGARACGVRGRAARSRQQLTIGIEGGEAAKAAKRGLGLLAQCGVERDDLGGLTRLDGHLGQLSRQERKVGDVGISGGDSVRS